jgi:hypothetical protein
VRPKSLPRQRPCNINRSPLMTAFRTMSSWNEIVSRYTMTGVVSTRPAVCSFELSDSREVPPFNSNFNGGKVWARLIFDVITMAELRLSVRMVTPWLPTSEKQLSRNDGERTRTCRGSSSCGATMEIVDGSTDVHLCNAVISETENNRGRKANGRHCVTNGRSSDGDQ